MSAGLAQCDVPTSIHCDHLIQALDGAETDLKVRSSGIFHPYLTIMFGSVQLSRTKKYLISCKVPPRSMALNSGRLVLVLSIKLFWKTMLPLEC